MATSIISPLIFFIVTILAASLVGITFFNAVIQQDASLQHRQQTLSQKITSDFTIEMISYNVLQETAFIYIRNTGKQQILPRNLEVYVNGQRIDKCSLFSLSINDTLSQRSVLQIAFQHEIQQQETLFTITDEFGNSRSHKTIPFNTTQTILLNPNGIC